MSLLPPVLVIDDSVDDRELLALVLRGSFGEVEVEEAADAAALARAVARRRFGLVVTEHELPWIRSGDVLRLVRDLVPGCPVVVFSRSPAERVAGEVLHLAPDGIVPKTSAGWVGLPRVLGQAMEGARGRGRGERSSATFTPDDTPSRPEQIDEIGYVISHDLARPLVQIEKFLDLLSREAAGQLGAEARGWLDQARGSTARLVGMVEAVLRCARIEGRGGDFARVELDCVLARALAHLEDDREAAGAEITADSLPALAGDAEQLEQLFSNLIANALKFRGAAPPRVHVGAAEEEEHWHLWVRDNGIGIAPKDFARVFVMFQRLHTESEFPGSGIGLAVCRRIVARHGGRIWVESRPGQGATFHLTLAKGLPLGADPVREESAWPSRER